MSDKKEEDSNIKLEINKDELEKFLEKKDEKKKKKKVFCQILLDQ